VKFSAQNCGDCSKTIESIGGCVSASDHVQAFSPCFAQPVKADFPLSCDYVGYGPATDFFTAARE
jgi:hypothetical protein